MKNEKLVAKNKPAEYLICTSWKYCKLEVLVKLIFGANRNNT